ncbi:MAG: ATP-binding cassette domain-containing protein [Candidatus Delongbacteria bacterium]|nr:ATP-binding cassette domain-containing protein [Candidatus Delongbacteria bacterium]
MKVELRQVGHRLNPGCWLFRHLNLIILPGSLITIYTPESRGKSTLLRLINLEEAPCEGSIIFNDQSVFPGLKRSEAIRLKSDMGLMLQPPLFLNDRSIHHNLTIMNYLSSHSTGRSDPDYWLNKTQLFGVRNKYPNELSFNEQQRLAFTRALIHHPSLILADQPFLNLDRDRLEHFRNLVLESRNQGTSWLITSQSPISLGPETEIYHLTEEGLVRHHEAHQLLDY